jgi:hypothetical protein
MKDWEYFGLSALIWISPKVEEIVALVLGVISILCMMWFFNKGNRE